MKKLMTTLLVCTMTVASQLTIGQGMGALNFSAIDADSNGELSPEEIAALPFVQSGNGQADRILTQWDTDGSGTVSEAEFNNRRAIGMGMGMGMGMG
ncbi:MAG: hypothetical protein ACJ0S4_09350 [Candidatus Rariloculaceae bacterium]